ncbi:hypothetical protein [Nocardioides marmorisolisilvae]|uniref:DUF4386 family protein n=1 Tax=Nocardioides marmorisolisilvae TaxID=1542737 RepID=A0A3N0DZB4_9ACTN|nr:hypothetical protein [Nocardioides marmorisolisilvae]RNL80901.1 hypothetical protein EFL95_00485 [Nocardioides marmorisolisilvae]
MVVDLQTTPDPNQRGRRYRRTVVLPGAAAALVALPLTVVVVLLILPSEADARVTDAQSARTVIAAAHAHPIGSWLGLLLAGVAYLIAAAALRPMAVAASGRFAPVVRIGYGLVLVGAVGLAMANAAVGVSLRAAVDPDVPKAASVATQIALQHDQGPLLPLFLAGLGCFLGSLLLIVGSAICRSLTWWQGLLAGAVAIGLPLAEPGLSGMLLVVVALAAAVALMPLTRLGGSAAENSSVS